MKYKKITQQQRAHYHPARLKPQAKYVFNSSRSWSTLTGKTPVKLIGTRPNLPFKVVGYDFSVENGLRLKPRSNFWLRSTLIITTLLTTLPLLWWLNSSSASIPSTASTTKSKRSFPINMTPVVNTVSVIPLADNSTKPLPTLLNHSAAFSIDTKPVVNATSAAPIANNSTQLLSTSLNTLAAKAISHSFNQSTLPWLHLTV